VNDCLFRDIVSHDPAGQLIDKQSWSDYGYNMARESDMANVNNKIKP
jgi:hypothetical protein